MGLNLTGPSFQKEPLVGWLLMQPVASDMRFDQFKQAIWEEWEAGKGK